jgi:hypothetical protein
MIEEKLVLNILVKFAYDNMSTVVSSEVASIASEEASNLSDSNFAFKASFDTIPAFKAEPEVDTLVISCIISRAFTDIHCHVFSPHECRFIKLELRPDIYLEHLKVTVIIMTIRADKEFRLCAGMMNLILSLEMVIADPFIIINFTVSTSPLLCTLEVALQRVANIFQSVQS